MHSVALRAARQACRPLQLRLGLRRLVTDPPKTPPTKNNTTTSSAVTETGSKASEQAAVTASKPAAERPELAQDYISNQHYVKPMDKLILALSFKHWPHKTPKRVSLATMNSAFGRLRIATASLTVFLMLYLMELAIRKGRAARDGGEECLYDTPTARSLQAKKRQWTREYELRKAIEEAERERAEKEQAAAAAAAAARS